MKDVQGQTRCVACEDAGGHVQMVLGGDRRELERVPTRRMGHERESGGERRRDSTQAIPRLPARDVPRLAAGSARMNAAVPVPRMSAALGVEGETDEELRLCEDTLKRKLRMLRERLENTQEVEACRVIARAIKESAMSVKAVREARAVRGPI